MDKIPKIVYIDSALSAIPVQLTAVCFVVVARGSLSLGPFFVEQLLKLFVYYRNRLTRRMPSYCTSATFRKPIENGDGSFTIKIAGDSKLHEFNGMPLKELSTEQYMSRAAPPVMLGHGRRYELPIGFTNRICYDADKDDWTATFTFAKEDEMADKCKNLFKQGLLFASIHWDIDELSRDWRTAEKHLVEWSLTTTPRDFTVTESFSIDMAKDKDCACQDGTTFTQEQLDAALAKQAEEYDAKLATQKEEYDGKFSTQKEEYDALSEKYDASEAKFAASEDAKKAEKLVKTYSNLLPEEYDAKTQRGVLEAACGNMLEQGKEYSVADLVKIADDLLLERAKVTKPEPKTFSRLPDTRFQGDLLLDLIVNR